MQNPFKAFLNIKRKELPLSLLMFSYFFLVITSFWILKPLKKGLFIGYYKDSGFDLLSWQMTAPQAELVAKVLNMVVAFVAVTVFTLLARRFFRQQLSFIFSAFFMVSYVVYTFLVPEPGDGTVWSFYLFGDLFSTLMVATFFAFLNDSMSPDSAKRLYGLIGLGGVTGGVFGTTFVSAWINDITLANWLWICFGLAVIIIIVAWQAGRLVPRIASLPPEKELAPLEPVDVPAEQPAKKENAAIEGAKLVFRSPYLLSVVGIVGLYEIVPTVMDFQFTSTVDHYVNHPDPQTQRDMISQHFATVFAITNWVSMLVQFFLTSFIMTRFGVMTALLILPLACLSGSMAFTIFPILWVGSFLNTADNGFSYSINQSAKEALYVPTSKDEKYKAKAFIDMFAQRFAKAIAVFVSLAITSIFAHFSSIRWLSMFTIAIVLVWIFAARYAGRKFQDLSN